MALQSFPGVTIGVTGGIGSGKSTVCDLFRVLGRFTISADPLARELMERDQTLRRKLSSVLGSAAYGADGKLNRGFVADRLFNDATVRKRVDGLVHPRVFLEIRRLLEETPPSPYAVIEAALIYESGMDRMLDAVLVVDASEATRVERVMRRDGITQEEIALRIRAQMKSSEKVRRADFVIRNDGDTNTLLEKVRFFDTLFQHWRGKGEESNGRA
jgi:dephospho-CoA kinase